MVVAWCLFQLVIRDEIRVLVFKETADKVEEAADEVGDDDGEEDEAEDAVDVLHDQTEDDFFATSLIAEERFDDLVHTAHVEDGEDALDTHKTEKLQNDSALGAAVFVWRLSIDTLTSRNKIKRNRGDYICKEATAR